MKRKIIKSISCVLAGLRGFMLDFCSTHDRKGVDQAVGLWLSNLDSMLTTVKEVL